ncbi:hypothetical protein Dda_6388 [Drechslerella dactyloides]|uniref:Apple domain-containing protein n=1 Tax=Drechslerella dactyloides TaxID=74499 RepID=A0AAD6ITF2_DREDA|nr:hypothetical protein Dda_6388 [Drechslerella dactyloides]
MKTVKQLSPAAAIAAALCTFMVQAAPAPGGLLVKRATPPGYKPIPSIQNANFYLSGTGNGWLQSSCDTTALDITACAALCNGNNACKTFNHIDIDSTKYCCLYNLDNRSNLSPTTNTGGTISASYAFEKLPQRILPGYALESTLAGVSIWPKETVNNGFISFTSMDTDNTVVTTAGCAFLCSQNPTCKMFNHYKWKTDMKFYCDLFTNVLTSSSEVDTTGVVVANTDFAFRLLSSTSGFDAYPVGDYAIRASAGMVRPKGSYLQDTSVTPSVLLDQDQVDEAVEGCAAFCAVDITQWNQAHPFGVPPVYIPCLGFNVYQEWTAPSGTFKGWKCVAYSKPLTPPFTSYNYGKGTNPTTSTNRNSYFYTVPNPPSQNPDDSIDATVTITY